MGGKLLQSFEERAKKSGSNRIIVKSSKYAYDFYIKNGFL
ncbi:TPA: hypothetical protein DEP21_00865 [Patescibacteria group bacterium]|nr:hypothetical protein [Candidatus Gracilibacteria bacterium]